MVAAVPVPVTVKMRLGWTSRRSTPPGSPEPWRTPEWRPVTVHGRTRCQKYEGTADWAQIARVKEAVDVPVFGSGDVEDVETLARRIEAGWSMGSSSHAACSATSGSFARPCTGWRRGEPARSRVRRQDRTRSTPPRQALRIPRRAPRAAHRSQVRRLDDPRMRGRRAAPSRGPDDGHARAARWFARPCARGGTTTRRLVPTDFVSGEG